MDELEETRQKLRSGVDWARKHGYSIWPNGFFHYRPNANLEQDRTFEGIVGCCPIGACILQNGKWEDFEIGELGSGVVPDLIGLDREQCFAFWRGFDNAAFSYQSPHDQDLERRYQEAYRAGEQIWKELNS
jgi:hypothetical protein